MFYQKKKDSKSDRIYYYECENVWDKDKKKYVCKRKLVGRWDPESETVIPTRPRNTAKRKQEEAEQALEPGQEYEEQEQDLEEKAPAKRGRKKKPLDYQQLYEEEVQKVQKLTVLLKEKDQIIQNQAALIEKYTAEKKE